MVIVADGTERRRLAPHARAELRSGHGHHSPRRRRLRKGARDRRRSLRRPRRQGADVVKMYAATVNGVLEGGTDLRRGGGGWGERCSSPISKAGRLVRRLEMSATPVAYKKFNKSAPGIPTPGAPNPGALWASTPLGESQIQSCSICVASESVIPNSTNISPIRNNS